MPLQLNKGRHFEMLNPPLNQPMQVIFVTRHLGAQQWANHAGLKVDRWEKHLDATTINSGDCIVGVLPVAMVAEVCKRGAIFIELVVKTPEHRRGTELSKGN